jgi:hypothetical protein
MASPAGATSVPPMLLAQIPSVARDVDLHRKKPLGRILTRIQFLGPSADHRQHHIFRLLA